MVIKNTELSKTKNIAFLSDKHNFLNKYWSES